MLNLNATEFGLLTAMPVLSGSLVRVPLGIWTDRFGGRIVLASLLAVTVPAIFLMAYATEYWHFLTIGLVLRARRRSFGRHALRGALVPKNRQGMAMGVFGAGNSGAAVSKFLAPVLLVAFGWAMVPMVYAAIMLGTLVLFWLFSHSDPAHLVSSNVRFTDQLKALKDPRCSGTASTTASSSAAASRSRSGWCSTTSANTTSTSASPRCWPPASRLPGGVLRAIGGMLSDKYGAHSVTWWVMWVSWICLFLLSHPQTDFTILTVNGPSTYHIGLNVTPSQP